MSPASCECVARACGPGRARARSLGVASAQHEKVALSRASAVFGSRWHDGSRACESAKRERCLGGARPRAVLALRVRSTRKWLCRAQALSSVRGGTMARGRARARSANAVWGARARAQSWRCECAARESGSVARKRCLRFAVARWLEGVRERGARTLAGGRALARSLGVASAQHEKVALSRASAVFGGGEGQRVERGPAWAPGVVASALSAGRCGRRGWWPAR
jgi:hypothetical protein